MTYATASLNTLIEQFKRLPGIGQKSAERIAYHILKMPLEEAMKIAVAIRDTKKNIRSCTRCYNLSEGELCEICAEPNRDQSIICVVEQPRDVFTIEASGVFRGKYHVLLGRISPLENIGPQELTCDALVQRIKDEDIKEVIIATNPDLEGDGTALYLNELLADKGIIVTRIAKGIPSGSTIEFVSKAILHDALSGRQSMHQNTEVKQ